jgi:hypothetical protein
MEAKKVALGLSGLLMLVFLVDFSSRLMSSVDVKDNQGQSEQPATVSSHNNAIMLSLEDVEKLLDWSDIKPKNVVKVEPKKDVDKVVVAAPKIDIHKQVRALIVGDKSKRLIGDDLLSLKGIFFDGDNFAVVEVENITTKKKQYFRAKVDEMLATHQLLSIGKNLVEIKNGDKAIKLQMFDQ